MSQKPTIVLVPGAWHIAATWNKVTSLLEAQQYKCISVTLPSTTGSPDTTFLDDINAARDAIVGETSQSRDVVVVVHSYGSMVGVSASKGLTGKKAQQDTTTPSSVEVSQSDQPNSGHVIGFIMIATGFVRTGVTFFGGFDGPPPPIWNANYETGFLEITIDPRELFYHDLPKEEGDYWVSKLTKQALKPLTEGGEHAYSAWMDAPIWFLATVEDRGLPFEFQKLLVQGAKDAGADVTMREIVTSHSPMLSRPEETVEFMQDALAYFARK
ncbi:hypothetical protein H2198_002746 [Neophaeococcomyces mojaviensis]|uniref:Uncharacterized protein n=1 Tax=Neophaeococcomyces mojaviensis TaxID=3383035 RepID=A0ACC3AD51_9EURO|nr:hypothetical protein H2198_002746 [Knufia sp. JES_112]